MGGEVPLGSGHSIPRLIRSKASSGYADTLSGSCVPALGTLRRRPASIHRVGVMFAHTRLDVSRPDERSLGGAGGPRPLTGLAKPPGGAAVWL